jgi:outer membrane protein TolC
MKAIITIILTCIVAGQTLCAQDTAPFTEAWGKVLQSIASNNKELKTHIYQSSIINAQYAAANTLPDPTVSYTRQYGNREGLGINGELIASQSFDFPTLYAERNKLAKRKAESLDFRHAELRRQILLQAQEICLDLVMLRQEQKLLNERLANARQLEQFYAKRLETGDANRLETNKISLELLNVKTESGRNAIAIDGKRKELEVLNGGVPIDFDPDAYEPLPELPSIDALYDEVFALDPELKALRSEQAVAGQALRVGRAGWLPRLEVGYQLNTATGGERFGGFMVGVSIPLFSNRPKVRQARAETLYAGLKYDASTTKTRSEFLRLYRSASALQESMEAYRRLLEEQNNVLLLNKALESGRISMIEYFVEVASIYDSLRNYIQLENDYQKTVSRLLKHRL